MLSADETLTLFERHLKQALRLYDDPERLGRESPLASPYVLSRALRDVPRPVTEHVRGTLLRNEIRQAAGRLWATKLPSSREEMLEGITTARRDPDDPRYSYVVLELRCFQEYVQPYRTSDIWEQPHLLPGSKSQHYRDFDAAIKRLSPLLLDSLRPTLRPEHPRQSAHIFGYEQQLAQIIEALELGRCVAISGPGGVGKTNLAAAAVAQSGARPTFWYTMRPSFNDSASSLLFALAAFLHEYKAHNLWQYLVSSNAQVGELNLALGLLRQDLALCTPQSPLICLDDLEHVLISSLDLSPRHAQLLDLIEGLRGSTALLLISQRPLSASDMHVDLHGLSSQDIMQMWQAAGRMLSSAQAEQLYGYTNGNARLLTLLLSLPEDSSDLPLQRDTAPSLLPAFQRLWRRLTGEERRALQQLCVYQGYAPEDLLDTGILESLSQLRLIELDDAGGVALIPALAPVIQNDLSAERRVALHAEAALVRLERGEYTAAAFHFVHSNQELRAIQSWFPQRQYAIARGEADSARQIFSQITRQQLGKPERKALDIIRAELHRLAGQHEQGLAELEQVGWLDESEASTRLWMLRGELQDALGYPDQAIKSYSEGLGITTRLLGQLAALRQRRGLLFQHQREHKASWQEIQHAEFDLEVLRGLMREEEGEYATALEAYQRARALAEQLDNDNLRAQSERWIAGVYGRRQQLEEAVAHAAQAIAIYERLGDRVNLEKMRSNLAFIYVQTRQFQQALEVGIPAYSFFVEVRDPYFAAVTGANLAEAAYELGDLHTASEYANQVLDLGDRHAAPYAHFTLGQLALAHNNPQAANEHFSQSMQRAQHNDDPYMVAYAQRALAQALLADHQEAQAMQHLQAALTLFRQLDIPGEVQATQALLGD